MARGRAVLGEKLERIMVQSQLMGLTTADMIKIANRMRALEVEREFIRDVETVSAGKTFEKKGTRHYIITTDDGHVFECKGERDYNGWQMRTKWTIESTYRKKTKVFKDQSLYNDAREIARVCPGGDRTVFQLMKQIHNKRWS